MRRRYLSLLPFCVALLGQPSPVRRVAITIDDGPVVNAGGDLEFFQRVSAGLIQSFREEKVPVTIFINERQLHVDGQRDARVQVVKDWLDAGFELGNHSYSHPSLNRVPLERFQDDVVQGEIVMKPLLEARGKKLNWFRYPFLHSGMTAEVHRGIVEFLEKRNYRVAPVTVDYADYTFAGVFTRMRRAGKEDVAEKVKQAYLEQVDAGFAHAEGLSKKVFGYEPPQILLIHCNELNSLTLRESIARMRKRGYEFITLEEAMKDPVYARPDTFAGSGGSWISRTAIHKGEPLEPGSGLKVPDWIVNLGRLP